MRTVVHPRIKSEGMLRSKTLWSQNRVRQEPRRSAGDRILVLADRQAAWRVVDQPASEHRILIGEIRQRRQRLPDESFRAAGAFLLDQRGAGADQRDIGAFARI